MDARGEMNDGDHAVSCCSAAEIGAFLDTLTSERETFKTTMEQVLASDVVLAKREESRIVGIGGLRRIWLAPLAYWVVSSPYQGRGYGTSICRDLVGYARQRHSFVVASVVNENPASIHICRKLGFKRCLFNYKFLFLFLPLSGWGVLLYPLYAVLFPLCWHGFFFLRRFSSGTVWLTARGRSWFEPWRKAPAEDAEAVRSPRRARGDQMKRRS